ncbi:hypothetical protein Mapa_005086 [Marchantia paleacea]|nr:hypothetical protein Mapa_005086 [Marchantia paleacea]
MSGGSNTKWILLMSLMSLTTQIMCAGLPKNFGGSKRNAWPEYKGLEVNTVLDLLRQDPKNNVFVQRPDSYLSRPRPSKPVDLTQDIWLYPDENDIVVIIPKRGLEHHSPVSGWTELVGMDWREAKAAILREIIGVLVVYGRAGFPRTLDFNPNRVFLEVGPDGKVATAPSLG